MGGWDTRAITDDVRAGARRARLRSHGRGSAAGGTRRSGHSVSGVGVGGRRSGERTRGHWSEAGASGGVGKFAVSDFGGA
jgi:hypothetical protein